MELPDPEVSSSTSSTSVGAISQLADPSSSTIPWIRGRSIKIDLTSRFLRRAENGLTRSSNRSSPARVSPSKGSSPTTDNWCRLMLSCGNPLKKERLKPVQSTLAWICSFTFSLTVASILDLKTTGVSISISRITPRVIRTILSNFLIGGFCPNLQIPQKERVL